MTADTPSIRINAGPANPGQFFAGCGLLELADTVSAPVQIDVCGERTFLDRPSRSLKQGRFACATRKIWPAVGYGLWVLS